MFCMYLCILSTGKKRGRTGTQNMLSIIFVYSNIFHGARNTSERTENITGLATRGQLEGRQGRPWSVQYLEKGTLTLFAS